MQSPPSDAKRKVADYGRWPTVWKAPTPPTRRSVGHRLATLVRTVRAAVGVLLFLAGAPTGLWWAFGNPLERLPTRQQLWEWLTQSGDLLTPAAVMGALLWAAWLIWAAAALAMVAELIAIATRWRLPRLRLPAPLHRLVFGLAGTAAITLTTTGRAGAAPPVAEVGTGAAPAVAVALPDQVEQGPATIHVGEKRYVYVVKRRDTLSKISKEWLGDAGRWPEICKLNWHRHWPKGGVLRDCDLIYPGWDLRLPADATPPASAAPKRPPAPPVPTPRETPSGSPAQPASSPTAEAPADPDGVTATPATTSPSTAPAVGALATPAHPDRSPTPATTVNPPNPAGPAPRSTPPADEHGVSLSGGSFITWSLAAAITAAAALVWLQRRRRYVPGRDESDLAELPPPVVELQRQTARRQPHRPASEDLAERAAAVPALPAVPPGGVGLNGDGAPAAARGALVSALASGGPHDPDRRGEVVIDRPTLTALFGEAADALGPWSRLHVADDLDHALAIIESRLLHRARVLDEHSLTDLDTLRERAPDEEPFPPVLVICHTPPPTQSARVRVTLGLGAGLDVSALLLGEWAHGPTIDVAADGRTRPIDGPFVDGISERVDALDAQSALAILATLREAHTGQPAPTITIPKQRTPDRPTPPHTDDAAQEAATGHSDSGQPVPDSQEQVTKASLRVLGSPHIENITLPGRPLRGKAAELAVYLACHPDGADTRTIGEHLAPESRLRQADQQIHTNASNLRHVLGRAAGPRAGGYVLKRGANARYRLDPTTVDIDLWQLRDLLGRAQLASAATRTQLLKQACDLYTEPLADGCDYEWVEPHREKVRRLGTEAHLLLADELLATDPHAAAELLEKAIGLDRYNEELYRKAMHTRHALHDPDGIRSLLRALTKALSDLDTEPTETTIELATQLRANLKEH